VGELGCSIANEWKASPTKRLLQTGFDRCLPRFAGYTARHDTFDTIDKLSSLYDDIRYKPLAVVVG